MENGRVIDSFLQRFRPDVAIRPDQVDFQPRVVDICSDASSGRYCRNVFEKDYKATIGVDFESEQYVFFNRSFILQLWDTAGQERFKSIAAAYFKGARVIVIAVDLTDLVTLNNSSTWLQDALRDNHDNDCDIYLVGTKKDLCSQSRYERKEQAAIAVANVLGAEYWTTSSLTGENVESFFNRVAALAFEKAVLREQEAIDSRLWHC
ncbi:ras-related protein Rab-36-like [Corticium candelabrum]|uniref:ras-related protein Rab-36-like n=1 Tax=Corticium candelabrum TaxID=121492 RepID=UPI002E263E4E|nr:ras-related protein Rab-36-like [Corticium candelabrum]